MQSNRIDNKLAVNVSQVNERTVASWVNVADDKLLDVDVADVLVHATFDVVTWKLRVNYMVSYITGAAPLSCVVNVGDFREARTPIMVTQATHGSGRKLSKALRDVIDGCLKFVIGQFGL